MKDPLIEIDTHSPEELIEAVLTIKGLPFINHERDAPMAGRSHGTIIRFQFR